MNDNVEQLRLEYEDAQTSQAPPVTVLLVATAAVVLAIASAVGVVYLLTRLGKFVFGY